MKKILLIMLVIGLYFSTAKADDNPMNSVGIEPTYTYKGGLNEAINLLNGNLNVTVPLLTLKGRAGFDLNLHLSYNSKQFNFWTIDEGETSCMGWNYSGPTVGRWVGNFMPYVRTWSSYSGGQLVWHAEATLETGEKTEFIAAPYPLGVATNSSDMQYHFESKILSNKSGIWYDFSYYWTIRKGDANGNYISFIGDPGSPGWISQIVDSLGRTVNFYYDNPDTGQLTRMTVLNNTGAVLTYSFEYQWIALDPGSHGYDIWYMPDSFWILSRINLPDGKSWDFGYFDVFLMPKTALERVNYPMGGYTRFEYSNGPTLFDIKTIKKAVNANNGQGEIATTYNGGGVSNPDGSTETHGFDSSGHEMGFAILNPSGVCLRSVYSSWGYWDSGYSQGYHLDWQQISEENNQYLTHTQYTYDSDHNLIEEFIQGQWSGPPFTQLPFRRRKTTRSFQAISVPRPGQQHPDILTRLQEEYTSDFDSSYNWTLISKTQYAYDQFALTNRSGMAGHDANFGTSFTTRGNLTTLSRWLASESRWINTKTYYDILGNVVQTTDARNNSTTTNYSLALQYAYPTQVINARGHAVSTNYSFYTGQVLSVTDANGRTTTTTYDSLNRATRIDSPEGGYVRATYDLAPNNFSSTVYKLVTTETAPPPPSAPQDLSALAVSSTQVNLIWTASSSAGVSYEVARYPCSTYSGINASCAEGSCAWADTNVAAGNAYVYRVRAVDTHGTPSSPSNADIATTIMFTEDPLVQYVTTVKSVHLAELRQAVAAVRSCAGMPGPSWTDASPTTGVLIKATHLQELRSQLDPALTQLLGSSPGYTDPTITPGTTLVKAAHFQEIRQAVK